MNHASIVVTFVLGDERQDNRAVLGEGVVEATPSRVLVHTRWYTLEYEL